MTAEFAKGVGDYSLEWLKSHIPEPDITIWMGNKTPREKGVLIAKRVASIAIPLFGDIIFKSAAAGSSGFVSGLAGLGLGLCSAGLNIGKAWIINKLIDHLIKDTSKYHLIKDEIKKVTDAAVSVLIGIAYLVATIVLPFFGPVGIVSASINLALNLATLARACYQLHEKRKDPLIEAQMSQISNLRSSVV